MAGDPPKSQHIIYICLKSRLYSKEVRLELASLLRQAANNTVSNSFSLLLFFVRFLIAHANQYEWSCLCLKGGALLPCVFFCSSIWVNCALKSDALLLPFFYVFLLISKSALTRDFLPFCGVFFVTIKWWVPMLRGGSLLPFLYVSCCMSGGICSLSLPLSVTFCYILSMLMKLWIWGAVKDLLDNKWINTTNSK